MEKLLTLDGVASEAAKLEAAIDLVWTAFVPDSVKEAIEGQYATTKHTLGEAMIARVSKEELERLSQRVMTVERANKMLADFETALVVRLTASRDELFVQGLMRTVQTWEFLAGHAGLLCVVLWEVLRQGAPLAVEAAVPVVVAGAYLMGSLFTGKFFYPDEEFRDEADRLTTIATEPAGKIVDIAWTALEWIIAAALIETFQDLLGKEGILRSSAPIGDEFGKLSERIERAALPQRPARTVRRRRVAR